MVAHLPEKQLSLQTEQPFYLDKFQSGDAVATTCGASWELRKHETCAEGQAELDRRPDTPKDAVDCHLCLFFFLVLTLN